MPVHDRKPLTADQPDSCHTRVQFDKYPAAGKDLIDMLRKMRLNLDDAEDQVQDTFLKHMKTRDTIHSDRAWLRQVARRRALALLRTTRRRVDLLGRPVALDLVQSSSDPTAEAERNELIDAVRSAVGRLSYRYRVVVELWMSGRTHREIGSLVGCSSKVSERVFKRALALLRGRLDIFLEQGTGHPTIL